MHDTNQGMRGRRRRAPDLDLLRHARGVTSNIAAIVIVVCAIALAIVGTCQALVWLAR